MHFSTPHEVPLLVDRVATQCLCMIRNVPVPLVFQIMMQAFENPPAVCPVVAVAGRSAAPEMQAFCLHRGLPNVHPHRRWSMSIRNQCWTFSRDGVLATWLLRRSPRLCAFVVRKFLLARDLFRAWLVLGSSVHQAQSCVPVEQLLQ